MPRLRGRGRGDGVPSGRRGASAPRGAGELGRRLRRLSLRAAQSEGRAFRTLAARLWLREVVPRRALHGDAGGVRGIFRAGLDAAGGRDRADPGAAGGVRVSVRGGCVMARRVEAGGRLIDRARPVTFRFDGRRMKGFAGDTLASALLASGRVVMGRSFKYHRPRGPVAAGAEEPNALVSVGTGARRTPNLRATVVPLAEGLVAESQNRWPSLDLDVGEVNAL